MTKVYKEHRYGSNIILCCAIIGKAHLVQDDGLVITRYNKTYDMVNNYIKLNTYN